MISQNCGSGIFRKRYCQCWNEDWGANLQYVYVYLYTCKVKFISEYAEIVVIGGNCMIFDIEGHSIYKVVLWEKTSVCWRCIFGWQRFWDYHQKSLATQFSLFTFFQDFMNGWQKTWRDDISSTLLKKGINRGFFKKGGL